MTVDAAIFTLALSCDGGVRRDARCVRGPAEGWGWPRETSPGSRPR
ncbi:MULTISPECIES: hypothetical protein [unclassified Amycolatopsis]